MSNDLSPLRRALLRVAVSLTVGAAASAWAQQPPDYSDTRAQELILRNCTHCHIAPTAEYLPREYWPLALKWMTFYVGYKGDELPDIKLTEMPATPPMSDYSHLVMMTDPAGRTKRTQVFKAYELRTDFPAMSPADWAVLREYFVSHAPAMQSMWIKRDKQPLLKGFKPKYPALDLPPNSLVLSLLVDEGRKRLYVGQNDTRPTNQGGMGGTLIAYDLKSEKRIGSLTMPTDTRDLELSPTGVRASRHGNMPVQQSNPQGQVIDWDLNGSQARVRMLANGFSRISQIHTHDMNGDGLDDVVVTGFGDGMLQAGGGRFSILWQTPEYAKLYADAPAEIPVGTLPGALKETVLMDRAGMIGSAIGDFNNDGKPDILLLTAQAQQQLFLYVNQGNGEFDQRLIMEHGPSFGQLSLEVGDFNQDGKLDIVVLNGNNVELVVPRPYHGIRLYENNGDLTFTERFYYPMHGATRAVVQDFDGDGDLDLAAIAIWPDWQLAEPETFVYLENKGNWQFAPSALDAANWGIWTHIAVGDVNGDKKPDIVLGLGNFRAFIPKEWPDHPIMKSRQGKAQSVLYLLNQRRAM